MTAIDALKIDVEGIEDLVLGPFLRDAPADAASRDGADRGYARLSGARTCSHCSKRAATLRSRAAGTTWRCGAGNGDHGRCSERKPHRPRLDRAVLQRLADWLAVAVAVTLPWSTSISQISIALWLIALLPTLDLASVRRELRSPAGLLPVLLWVRGGCRDTMGERALG